MAEREGRLGAQERVAEVEEVESRTNDKLLPSNTACRGNVYH